MWRQLLLPLLLVAAQAARAQRAAVFAPHIASLQVVAEDRWQELPVVRMDKGERVHIAFDDLTHQYHRYTYRLEHCEPDFTTSQDLFASDFCDGFAEDNVIDDMEESINTLTLYNHYAFTLPNSKCRPTLSGNYRVSVQNEDGDDVLEAYFMLAEPGMTLTLGATTNTDRGNNTAYQQLAMRLNYQGFDVRDMGRQIRVVVVKNAMWDSAVVQPTPQYVAAGGMGWDHNAELIFDGGNEYRKFETLDPRHTTMGVENVWREGDTWHAECYTDLPRPNYSYDVDANGAFLIRNSDNRENDTASDYVQTHFTLQAPDWAGEIFIDGNWTNPATPEQYVMHYDPAAQCYRATLTLKQGYYSYQYLTRDAEGRVRHLPSEGNFHETENAYSAFAYYKGLNDRTFRLVAYSRVRM